MKPIEPTDDVVKILKNHLVWVDPDDFDALINSVSDFLKNYGKHEGPCFPSEIDNYDSPCVLHRENFNRRQNTVAEALKVFNPEFVEEV